MFVNKIEQSKYFLESTVKIIVVELSDEITRESETNKQTKKAALSIFDFIDYL